MDKEAKSIGKGVFLLLILALAFFLRVYKVTENPPSLNWDEVSIGYNAYSIYKSGKDEWGKFLPLHFRAYGEYKLPAQIYASIPGIAVFGLNELGVRITPVVYGTLTVLLLYLLTQELFKKPAVALTAAFLLAISPWHIHLTRASFESSFSVFWVLMGIWFMVKGSTQKKWLLLSVIPWVIAIYTYNAARVFVPLFLLTSFLIYRKEFVKHKKVLLLSVILFVVFLLPLVPFSLRGEVANRYKLVSIFNEPGLIPRIDEARNLSSLPEGITRLIHNRVTYTTFYFISNYLVHFTPDYLFINGAPHKQHHVQDIGQLYFIQAPFILVGILLLFKTRSPHRWLLLTWLLLAFIPVAVTRDSIPHALRTIIAAPTYQILTAYGLVFGLSKIKKEYVKRTIVVGAFIALGVQFAAYLNNYYNIYPKLYSRDWQYGYKQVVSYIKENYDKYDKIVFSRTYGEPHMFSLFYLAWDPASYQDDPNLVRFQAYDWVWVTNFDKFYFPDLGDRGTMYADLVKKYDNKKVLFVGKPGDFPEYLPKLLEVNFLNGKEAFEVVEYH